MILTKEFRKEESLLHRALFAGRFGGGEALDGLLRGGEAGFDAVGEVSPGEHSEPQELLVMRLEDGEFTTEFPRSHVAHLVADKM